MRPLFVFGWSPLYVVIVSVPSPAYTVVIILLMVVNGPYGLP